jgi:hypothetical protein
MSAMDSQKSARGSSERFTTAKPPASATAAASHSRSLLAALFRLAPVDVDAVMVVDAATTCSADNASAAVPNGSSPPPPPSLSRC